MTYKIVIGYQESLERQVNEMLDAGWKLSGGVAVMKDFMLIRHGNGQYELGDGKDVFCQAMLK